MFNRLQCNRISFCGWCLTARQGHKLQVNNNRELRENLDSNEYLTIKVIT